MNWVLLKNSLLVSGAATLLSLVLGSMVALALACWPEGWRKVGLGLSVVAFALPPFVITGCWIDLLGQTGVWRGWLPFDIYSPGGTVWVLGLMLWPLTMLLVSGAISRLDREMLETNPALAGGALIKHLLWPFVRASLSLAAVVTFVLALNQFSVPAILQTKVYPAEVWLRFNTEFDYGGALQASWLLVLAPLLMLWWVRGRTWNWPAASDRDISGLLRMQLGAGWSRGLTASACLILALALGLPLLRMAVSSRTWSEFGGALAAGQGAVFNSFFYAAVTSTAVCALGLVTRRFRVGQVLWVLFLVPGVLLGIGLIYLLNRPTTAWLYQGFGVVFLALGLRYLALGWSGARSVLAGVDRELSESARMAGVSGWRLFREVDWPQAAGSLLAGWYVVYLLCLWDVESIVLILPPGGETLAVRIFNLLHYGHNSQVDALCLVLLGLAVAPLLAFVAWRQLKLGGNDR